MATGQSLSEAAKETFRACNVKVDKRGSTGLVFTGSISWRLELEEDGDILVQLYKYIKEICGIHKFDEVFDVHVEHHKTIDVLELTFKARIGNEWFLYE